MTDDMTLEMLAKENARLREENATLRAAKKRVCALSFDEYRAKGERLAWWAKGYNAAITDALRALDGDK